jgi:hypothetical protein
MDGLRPTASPTCFLHIPKSGGSSVHAALERALPPGSLAPRRMDMSSVADFDDFERLRPQARALLALEPYEVRDLRRYRVVSGHFFLATLLQITDAASIATVLREPRTRLLSLYMFWRVSGIHDFWAPSRAGDHALRPLAEFLSERRLAPVVDNQLCRMLLAGDPRLDRLGFAASGDIVSIARDASERLDALGFVGVLERGDDMWGRLSELFGVTLEPLSVNRTEDLDGMIGMDPREPVFTPQALELIEQRTAADMLVYDHVLARAGLGASERRQLKDGAFAQELVKLGDLVGRSAARAAEQAALVGVVRVNVEEGTRTIRGLEATLARSQADLDRSRRWLDAVHSSASWRLTAPLRAAKRAVRRMQPSDRASPVRASDRSLVSGWSVNQIWWFALALCATIAATDAILSHVALIAVLALGPCCGAFTGRWRRTACVGIVAIALAVPLGLADRIWDTRAQMVDLAVVAVIALLSTVVTVLVGKRREHQSG